MFYH